MGHLFSRFYSPKDYSRHGWAVLKPEARHPSWVFSTDRRNLSTWVIIWCFPGTLAGITGCSDVGVPSCCSILCAIIPTRVTSGTDLEYALWMRAHAKLTTSTHGWGRPSLLLMLGIKNLTQEYLEYQWGWIYLTSEYLGLIPSPGSSLQLPANVLSGTQSDGSNTEFLSFTWETWVMLPTISFGPWPRPWCCGLLVYELVNGSSFYLYLSNKP